MAERVIVVGSGAGGATAAMVLAEAGFDVVILEKGRNEFDDLTKASPGTRFSNDELKSQVRSFARPDPEIEPRTYRYTAEDAKPRSVGRVQDIPQTVGGATVHWDAKTPRFWDIDFRKRSLLGPVDGADVIDWPFDYAELAPFYDEVEVLIGVAGNINEIGPITLQHAPRGKPLPMPAGPAELGSLKAAAGARAMGLHPFPAPMAINTVPYQQRAACNNCGFCSGYGCPIHARVGALAPLRRALKAGAELRDRAYAVKVAYGNGRATGVTWLDVHGRRRTERADLVVLAANAIETARLALLSNLPDPNGLIGRFLMFHWFTEAAGIFLRERLHAYRGRASSHVTDDFADPDFPGAREAAAAAGLPYFRGGTIEMGGGTQPIQEAGIYQGLLQIVAPDKPFGTAFKQLMRASLLRDRIAGLSMVGEDLAYPTNTVDLDPRVKDHRALPVARITYSPGDHEFAAFNFYRPRLAQILQNAGAETIAVVPGAASSRFPIAGGDVPTTAHIMGGMRMSPDPKAGVTDGEGRLHTLGNVFVADGAVFPSSGGHNPTLTIIATALRNARRWAGTRPRPRAG